MEQHFYRVLQPMEEPQGELHSSESKSPFCIAVFDYWKLSLDIYILAKKTGLKVVNAVRVAENVPAFLDELNAFFKSNESSFDLLRFGIDDPIKVISSNDLYEFSYNYINDANETGLFYDWGMEHYLWEFIWEMVRSNEYPNMPSRMESLFLFDKEENASDFFNQYRDPTYCIANIKLLEGKTESFDMNWFSNVPSDVPITEVEKYARNYWEQKYTDNPVVEVLFQGTYQWN